MRSKMINYLSVASILSVLIFEGLLVYALRVHFTYTSIETVVLPLTLLGASLIATLLFLIRLILSDTKPEEAQTFEENVPKFLKIRYSAIKLALSQKLCGFIGLVTAFSYAYVFMLAQGMIVEAPLGPSLRVITEGLPGYAPILLFFPFKSWGLILSTYQLAVMLSLSLFVGVNSSVLVYLYGKNRAMFKSFGLGLSGATIGFFVSCPTCVTAPILVLVSSYLLPLIPAVAVSPSTESLVMTVIYFSSLFLLLLGLSFSSRTAETGLVCKIRNK